MNLYNTKIVLLLVWRDGSALKLGSQPKLVLTVFAFTFPIVSGRMLPG